MGRYIITRNPVDSPELYGERQVQDAKWWSKLLVISAAISVFLLLASPIGYQNGIPLETSFTSLLVSLGAALMVLAAGLVMLVIAIRSGLTRDRNITLIAMVIAVIPLVAMGPQIGKGGSVPQIHDITTDTDNPPVFQAVLALRTETDNSLEYALEGSAEKLASTQKGAYPGLDTLESALTVSDAVNRAASILMNHGLEIVSKDQAGGIVEATATSFWFGFKDDLVVRVVPNGSGSSIDVRSASRVGLSDVGVNAARIRKFIATFQGSSD